MRKLILVLATALTVVACSPTEIELLQPEPTETPGDTIPKEPTETNNFNNNKYWILYKDGKFELYNSETKAFGQFKIDDAERLLRMPATVWSIPSGAPYVFSSINGLLFDKRLLK